MNASNENLKPANKHNPRIPYIAAENMGKAMLDLFLQEQKAAPDVWQKMSAQQQSETIERFRLRVQYAIAGAVNTIVTGGHTALAGTIDTVNIKDKIKLTVIVSKSNLSESLAELYASGSESSCQILLADAAQYCGGMDLVEADPDQRELFSDAGSVLPDDAFLWAINLPLMSGGASLIPAPNRKEAELFARSIREKLYELNQVDYAKSVYAHLWPLNNGEHTRSTNKGNWEAMINWFGQLCAGEVDIAPVALIGHAPDAAETGDAPEADDQMAHLITVTEIDDYEDEVTSLHMSRSDGMNALYRELGVPELNQGTNGDGEAEIDRGLVAAAGEALAWQGHSAQSRFLREVLEYSPSLSFCFNFS